jgi:hypothetical protein
MTEELQMGSRTIKSNMNYWSGKGVWEKVWSELIPPGSGGRLLDVGAAVHCWSCSDYAVERFDQFEGRLRAGWTPAHTGDLNKPWPFKDNAFDGVTAVEVMEHIEGIWHFLREATRVAKEFVIVTTPNVECEMSREMFHDAGYLFGFSPRERERHRHINPVFAWQVENCAKELGWKLELSTMSPRLSDEPVVEEEVAKFPQLQEVSKEGVNERNLVGVLLAP